MQESHIRSSRLHRAARSPSARRCRCSRTPPLRRQKSTSPVSRATSEFRCRSSGAWCSRVSRCDRSGTESCRPPASRDVRNPSCGWCSPPARWSAPSPPVVPRHSVSQGSRLPPPPPLQTDDAPLRGSRSHRARDLPIAPYLPAGSAPPSSAAAPPRCCARAALPVSAGDPLPAPSPACCARCLPAGAPSARAAARSDRAAVPHCRPVCDHAA